MSQAVPDGGSGGYDITGVSSNDNLCPDMRAVNKYGASAWSAQTCYTVPM